MILFSDFFIKFKIFKKINCISSLVYRNSLLLNIMINFREYIIKILNLKGRIIKLLIESKLQSFIAKPNVILYYLSLVLLNNTDVVVDFQKIDRHSFVIYCITTWNDILGKFKVCI